MRRSSSRSAGATWLDRAERIEQLRAAARRAAQHLPEIRRVVLFGSLATGTATPRSDADLLVVLDDSRLEPRDRIPPVLAAFSPLPCPLDLFVFTVAEVEGMGGTGSPILREAATGVSLLER